jgi:DNA-binding Lrp family transcriptional regulator
LTVLMRTLTSLGFLDNVYGGVGPSADQRSLWAQDKAYSTLMKELWGSPGQWNAKKSYAAVARKLGVDEETVRNRIKRLRESGFLLGWRLFPNPTLLGCKSAFLLLELADPGFKEKAISKLLGMDGVVNVVSLYGKGLLITIFDDEHGRFSRQIAQLGKMEEVMTGMTFPSCTFRMTSTDWQIARRLLRNAERDARDIAKELKISTRTVTRRLNQMMSGSATFIAPVVDLRNSGGVSYHLLVQCENGKKSEVDKAVAYKIDDLVFRATYSVNGLIFGFTEANVAQGNETLKWVRRQEGVASAQMNITEEVVHSYDWLDREFENRAEHVVRVA